MSYNLMMEDIFHLFDYLGIEKTNLLGHSMGGKLAMLITLLRPHYIDNLIIADIAPINYPNDNQNICLLYTSDAADDMQCVDLGGRRIIKKYNILYD